MKKCLAIIVVLALVAPAMAVDFTITGVDTSTAGTAVISWTAGEGVVGMGLEVAADNPIATVAVDSFFDVFVDSAFDLGVGYDYPGTGPANGIPTATVGAPGELALPQSSFSISVGGLDDDGIGAGTEEAPTSGTITLTTDGTTETTLTITEDMLRGGIVGYNGAMTLVDTSSDLVDIVIAATGGLSECQTYNLSKVINSATDNVLNAGDITLWVNYVNANRVAPTIFAVIPTNPNYDARYNFDAVATINTTDIIQMVNYINANRVSPTIFARICP